MNHDVAQAVRGRAIATILWSTAGWGMKTVREGLRAVQGTVE